MFGRLVSSLFVAAQRITPAILPVNAFHSLITPSSSSIVNVWSLTQVRTKVRCHFPRPGETKRVKKHGWLARMSTPNGRRILMRRILKGRHVLSH